MADDDRTTFTWGEGRDKITVPRLNHLPVGVIRKTRKIENTTEQAFVIFEELCDKKSLDAFDRLTTDTLEQFMSAWQADSGVELGESGASPTS